MKYKNKEQGQRDAKTPHTENTDEKWTFDICCTSQRTGKDAARSIEWLRNGNDTQHSRSQGNYRFIASKKTNQRLGKQDVYKRQGEGSRL